ncbi:MAG: hypothetical protein EPN36_12045 [Rhodanobacteraceae bacterium]|nr:MAG: hypothetical protein EPN36_12045 [Rhodanobacteraceae bacterium]
MNDSCTTSEGSARDLTRGMSAWLLWYLPIVALVVGGALHRGGAWLPVAAFAVMGAGCLANMARCGRLHCYVTGPLCLLAAIWYLLLALGRVPPHPGVVGPVILVIVLLAFAAEFLFGRYTKAHRPSQ